MKIKGRVEKRHVDHNIAVRMFHISLPCSYVPETRGRKTQNIRFEFPHQFPEFEQNVTSSFSAFVIIFLSSRHCSIQTPSSVSSSHFSFPYFSLAPSDPPLPPMCRQWNHRCRFLHREVRLPLRSNRIRGRVVGRIQRLQDRRHLSEEAAPCSSETSSGRFLSRPMVRSTGYR